MLRYIFSFCCFVTASWLLAQNTAGQLPKEKRDYRPSMLRLSYDALPFGEKLLNKNRFGHHFQAAIDFSNYYLVVEYGVQQSDRGSGYGYDYQNQGSYFRVGPEVNLLKNSRVNSINFGLRYARSAFEDHLSFTKTISENLQIEVDESNNQALVQWAEFTAGLSVNVLKGFYMGYTIRYKFLKKVKNVGTLIPYDIPGFGLNQNKVGVGFSYFIGWTIPFRKAEEAGPPVAE